ncbi:MAG: hypothetical protein PUA75_01585 [Clostridiales bacterium]|nr:hypothetical protein [Clostridiales bacterium]
MCTQTQLHQITSQMVQCYHDIYGADDVVVSPTVIPYDEFEEYKGKLPYYRNIAKEAR